MIGSYANGFAPRDYEPEYPQLWNGLVGAWCPSLGPTGATLRDWGGRALHATINGIALADAWVISPSGKGGSGAIKFTSASSSYAEITHNSALSFADESFEISFWMRLAVVSGFQAVISKDGIDGMTGGEYEVRMGDTANRITLLIRQASGADCGRATANTFGDLAADTWYFVHAFHDSAASVCGIGVNGIYNTVATTGTPWVGSGRLRFGTTSYTSFGTGFLDGMLDDVRIRRSYHPAIGSMLYGGGRGIAYQPRERRRVKVGGGRLLQLRRACA